MSGWTKRSQSTDALEAEFELICALMEARARAGLTQAEVAERMGTTPSVVARLEGALCADLKDAEALCGPELACE